MCSYMRVFTVLVQPVISTVDYIIRYSLCKWHCCNNVMKSENMIVQMSVSLTTILFTFCFLSILQPLTPLMWSLMPKRQHWWKVHWHHHFAELKINIHVLLLRFSQQLMLNILVLHCNFTRLHHWSSSWCQDSQQEQNIDGSIHQWNHH